METAKRVMTEVGPVTMLINNAGVYPIKPVVDVSPEELKLLFHTNIIAHFWTLQAFLPSMIEKNHGHIVAVSSAASLAPVPNEVTYSVTKAAVTGLMEGMVQELRLNPDNKIKVTCIHPYYTAVRDDIPVRFDLRFERMSPDYVAAEIVKGIRQNREMISIPRFMHFWLCFMRCLPQDARKYWRKVFYTYVWPLPEDPNHVNNDTTMEIDEKSIYPELKHSPVKISTEANEVVGNGNTPPSNSQMGDTKLSVITSDTDLSYTESDFEKPSVVPNNVDDDGSILLNNNTTKNVLQTPDGELAQTSNMETTSKHVTMNVQSEITPI